MTKTITLLLTTVLFNTGFAYADDWRRVDPNNMVVMTLPQGEVIIELAPQFAAKHVAQFIKLTQKEHYHGSKFYRVIDGFVAQAGPEKGSLKDRSASTLQLEGSWPTDKNWSFTPVQKNDLYAEVTGFKQGFALAHNPSEQQAWLAHCPGTLAMARKTSPNSATSHFYITIGQAPRQLDRIMTIFGRVILGMNHVQAITRTSVIDGQAPVSQESYTSIITMKLMSDLPKAEQKIIEVQNTESPSFSNSLQKRRARASSFYFKKPPPVLDVCQIKVKSRLVN